MSDIWNEMLEAARRVQRPREISERVYAGGVAAAIESASGRIYTGVCVDTSCTLGICAERNAIFNMITNGEGEIRRVLALMPAIFNMITNGEGEIRRVLALMPDGTTAAPCGACRELMAQLMPGRYQGVEVMVDYAEGKVMTLGELTPEWWL